MVAVMGLRPHAYTGLMTYSSSVASLMRARVRRPELIFETVHGSYGTRQPVPAPRPAAPSPAVVGFFGRILRYKGIDRLADAVALLRAEGRAVELRVHGRGRITADLADRLRRAGAVVDNRWIDEADVADVVASFDVVAIPYSEASQSGVVGYAMNAGVPVVTTPHPGLLEQVVAPGVGIAARDLTPAAFAAALAEVIDDDSLYARLSTEGPIAARTQFGWDQVVDDVLQATAALRARRRRGRPATERALPMRSHRGDVS
jgi:glycosyltransferase involved in cell wall biosynthesis